MLRAFFSLSLCVALATSASAGAPKAKDLPKEADYYQIQTYELPKGEVIEVGALEMLPDGRLAVGTRRGEIWMVHNPLGKDLKEAKITR